MRYSIQYKNQLPGNAKNPTKSVPNVVTNRSGNPGYFSNYPLLVSSVLSASEPAVVNQNGFIAYDHDDVGKCYDGDGSKSFNYHNRILRFGQTESLTCSNSFKLAELEAYCKSSDWTKKLIFKQFDDKFKFVSRLGNPSLNHMKDWLEVTKKGFPTSTVGTWDPTTNTCEMVTGYNIVINTSVLGFQRNL